MIIPEVIASTRLKDGNDVRALPLVLEFAFNDRSVENQSQRDCNGPEVILKRSGGIPSGPAPFDPSMLRRSLVIVETSASGDCGILTRRVNEKLS